MVHFLLKYLETFRDIGALLCEGGGIKYLETFRDICAVVWGGGLEYGSELTVSSKQGGLVVSVAACRLSGPSSSLTQGTILFLVCSRGGGEGGLRICKNFFLGFSYLNRAA